MGLLLVLLFPLCTRAAEPAKVDVRYPFRTDFANAHLPWYQIKPGEFPPHHSEHRIGGTLREADFIHRCGQFQTDGTQELVNFRLPPFGSVMHLNAEADLRDVPLGTHCSSFSTRTTLGASSSRLHARRLHLLASQGLTYRLTQSKLSEKYPARHRT